MERSNLLRAGVVGIGAAAFSGALWREAFAAPAQHGFNPAGNRLYFSSQRGTTGSSSAGITYEVTGPFRR